MTDIREKLDELEALAAAAKSGPWSADWDDNGQWYIEPLGVTGTALRGDSCDCIESATAHLIVAARNSLPRSYALSGRCWRSGSTASPLGMNTATPQTRPYESSVGRRSREH